MHPGIFNGPRSTKVNPDASSRYRAIEERIKNTSGFYDSTWLDAYFEFEQYLCRVQISILSVLSSLSLST